MINYANRTGIADLKYGVLETGPIFSIGCKKGVFPLELRPVTEFRSFYWAQMSRILTPFDRN
jgi:hypothetical protein